MSKELVTKHNALIEACYRLSLTEMRILVYGISLINPTRENFPLSFRIDIKSFATIFNINHKDTYNDVKEAVLSKFWERDFSYKNDAGKTVVTRWLTKIIYQDNEGYLEIKFNEDLQPLLHQMRNNFTKYSINHIATFKSVYSVRLYEFCLMWLNRNKSKKCSFNIKISAFKERLFLENKYERFYDFNNRVLETGKKEINKHSDIRITYEIIKKGRSPFEIKFTVSKKKEKQTQGKQSNAHENVGSQIKKIDREILSVKESMSKYNHSQEAIQSFQKQIEDLSDKKLPLLKLLGNETP